MGVMIILLMVLNVGAGHSLNIFPFPVRSVSNFSLQEAPRTRIYGETQALEGQFPFMIFTILKWQNRMSQCSAGLVKPDWVLLAAHCVYFEGLRPSDIIMVGGKADVYSYVRWKNENFNTLVDETIFNLQERIAKKFVYHPKYDTKTYCNDIALVQVQKPFDMSSVSLIPVPQKRIQKEKKCTILGWGLIYGNKQTFKLNYATEKAVSTTMVGCLHKVSGPFICLKPDNRGICQGDSGSPLVCDGKAWGVASHIISSKAEPDCSDSIEEYYTEIYHYRDWMESVYSTGNLNKKIGVGNLLLCVFTSIWLCSR